MAVASRANSEYGRFMDEVKDMSLFPLWERKVGRFEGGPVSVMRAENRRIAEQLDVILRKVTGLKFDTDRDEQAIMILLTAHNKKEEQMLYPAIDDVVTPLERADIFRAIEELLKDRGRVYCEA